MTAIMIVDDHDLVRTGLKNILADAEDFELVGEASSGEEAIHLARDLEPDVILMDVGLPGLSGLETTERILKVQPDIRVIVLTAHSEPPLPARLLDIGATGYLTKACNAQELINAVRTVRRGERYIGADIAQQLALSLLPGTPQSPFQELTGRELEIALMLIQGMKMPSIGEVIKVSPKTVATYKYRIYEKIGVNSEVELLRMALRYGLVSADSA
ncbi:response regulator [Wenzhouxiangella sp. AB-CW3]|uniref:response regulator n=1 Tax=Wenzhouxiangella sp. AB-CW3 TaxID=2771012 RepID=UPI00168ACC71|nr:response regulator [Wenzhouxiangella sp. AB-CW3]QOC21115.1 response regulator [Wenzhouxiangella sp. AB-CW3]